LNNAITQIQKTEYDDRVIEGKFHGIELPSWESFQVKEVASDEKLAELGFGGL